jgi:integrase
LRPAGRWRSAPSTYLGHASITVTIDRYGHLMPGNQEQAAGQLDHCIVRAATS